MAEFKNSPPPPPEPPPGGHSTSRSGISHDRWQSQGHGTSRSAGSDDRGLEPGDPEYNRPNRGSRNHPHNCKPCNKIFPGRENSCKHGVDCEYCHMDHDRPKHRSQRGRHALQRREYFESREEQPPDLRKLIDEVYEVPRAAIVECKMVLQNLGLQESDDKTRAILEEMNTIAEQAQYKRPDSLRLQGARLSRSEEAPGPVELDDRRRWLVGTVHLVVRKMADAKEPVAKMREILDVILDKCRALPKLALQDRSTHHMPHTPLLWLAMKLVRIPEHPNVEFRLRELVSKAKEDMSLEQLKNAIDRVMGGFYRLPEAEKLNVRHGILACNSLPAAAEEIERVHEDFKMRLLQAEEEEDDMGIEDLCNNLDRKSALVHVVVGDYEAIRAKEYDILNAVQTGYKCIHGILKSAVEKDKINRVDPCETLKRLDHVKDIVKSKVPSMAKFMEGKLKQQAEEIEKFVRKQLEPNHGVQDMLDKLVDMTKYFVSSRGGPPPGKA